MVVEIMLRLFHCRKKYQDFGIHGVAELRFEMQTNGTMSRLGRGEKNQGHLRAPTTYSFLQKTQIQIALISKK